MILVVKGSMLPSTCLAACTSIVAPVNTTRLLPPRLICIFRHSHLLLRSLYLLSLISISITSMSLFTMDDILTFSPMNGLASVCRIPSSENFFKCLAAPRCSHSYSQNRCSNSRTRNRYSPHCSPRRSGEEAGSLSGCHLYFHHAATGRTRPIRQSRAPTCAGVFAEP